MLRRFAIGHTLQDDALQVVPWHMARSGHPAGSNFASSIRDQLGYARFHLGDGGGVLRRDTLKQMQTRTTPDSGPYGEAYGIGWALRDIDGVRIVAHGGTTFGHESAFEMVPERGLAVAVLTNAGHGGPLHEEITKWVFDAYLGLVERLPEPLAVAPAELAEYEGVYAAASGTLTVSVEGDRLQGVVAYDPAMLADLVGPDGDFPPPPPFSFKLLPDDGFIVVDGEYTDMRGPFLRDAQGTLTGLNLGGRVMLKRGV
jgi:CubicO group peptidase (beta-lactamase class C family)